MKHKYELSLRFKRMRVFRLECRHYFILFPEACCIQRHRDMGEISQKSTHHCRTVMKTQQTTFRYRLIFSDAGRNLPRLAADIRIFCAVSFEKNDR